MRAADIGWKSTGFQTGFTRAASLPTICDFDRRCHWAVLKSRKPKYRHRGDLPPNRQTRRRSGALCFQQFVRSVALRESHISDREDKNSDFNTTWLRSLLGAESSVLD